MNDGSNAKSAPLKEEEPDPSSSQSSEELLQAMCPNARQRFTVADNRRKEDDRKTMTAHARLVEVRGEFFRVRSKLEKAQKVYNKARTLSQEHSEQDADNLMLEPTEWNSRYLQLKAYFDREGHSHLKRNITDVEVKSMSEEEATEIRAMSRWACRQRKLKRSGELEHYKVLLLNRLNFDWEPKTGHGPEKWLKNYDFLKDFKEAHRHVDVPMQYGENKLGLWVKTQLTLYRNGKEGKLPALSSDRIRMLEELGITWGERRKGIPWDDRYHALLEYKERFGHVHVPWQWQENVGLAQWVNTQRKKYKDRKFDGKKNNLSDAQIEMLNGIGFKWSTGGKGRYAANAAASEQPSKKKARTSNVSSSSEQKSVGVAGAMAIGKVPSPVTTPSSGISVEAEASASKFPKVAVNSQQAMSQRNPNDEVIANIMAQNSQGNSIGSLYNGGLATIHPGMNLLGGISQQAVSSVPQALLGASQPNFNNMLGGMSQQQGAPGNVAQALPQNNDITSLAAQAQALQQLVNQQLAQPQNNSAIGAQQQAPTQILQQLLSNQQQMIQPLQSTPSFGMAGTAPALQATQNDSSSFSQAYQQLLNQQMNTAPSSTLGGPSQQPFQNGNLSVLSNSSHNSNNLSLLSNASQNNNLVLQQLLGQQQSTQPQNNNIGTLPQAHTNQNDTVNLYQQLLNQQMNQSSPNTSNMFDPQSRTL